MREKRVEVLFSGLGNTEQKPWLVVWCPAGLLGLLLASPTAHGAAGEVVAGGTSLLPVRGCNSLQQQQKALGKNGQILPGGKDFSGINVLWMCPTVGQSLRYFHDISISNALEIKSKVGHWGNGNLVLWVMHSCLCPRSG